MLCRMFPSNNLINSRYILQTSLKLNYSRNLIFSASTSMERFCMRQKKSSPEKKGDSKTAAAAPDINKDHTRTITRETVKNSIQIDKEKYLHMPIEEKRKTYKCRNEYVTLDKVPTWQETFTKDRERLLEKVSKKDRSKQSKEKINEDLNRKVSVWRGDITTLEIDAIVNAANNSLLGGGGVDGAIHIAAGAKLKAECATLGGCDTGDAKITGGYKLPSKYVIHTVGPVGEKPDKLERCYKTCLKRAQEKKVRSLAFPCISTGIYGYPNEKAAPLVLETIREWLDKDKNAESIDRIIFCLFMKVDVNLYEELMQQYFPVGDQTTKDETSSDDEGNGKNAIENNGESNKTSPKQSTDVNMRNVPKINTEEKSNTDSKMVSKDDTESDMQTEESEHIDTDSKNIKSEEASESKLNIPLTRSKRPKGKVKKEDLTPTELAPPPKFKFTAMDTT